MKFKHLNFNSPATVGEKIITTAIKNKYPSSVIDDLAQQYYSSCDINDKQFNEINAFVFKLVNMGR